MTLFKLKKSFPFYVIALFLVSAFLLGGDASISEERIQKLFLLPEIVVQINKIFYFLILAFFATVGFLQRSKGVPFYYYFLYVFYFLFLFISVLTFSDYFRYFILMVSILFVPRGLSLLLSAVEPKKLSSGVLSTICFFVFLSLFYSYMNLGTHPRISGIYNNPNLFGMWLCVATALLLYFNSFMRRSILILLLATIFLMLVFTGSRLTIVVFFIILLPFFYNNIRPVYLFSLILLLTFFLIAVPFDFLPALEFRSFQLANAISDSGRSVIWSKALMCIADQPLVGHGMEGAENCVGIGNVHNSYLRVFVMMGVPLGVFSFVMFFSFLFFVLFSNLNPYVKSFFLSIPILFFGEDYIVGLASPFYPSFLLFCSLVLLERKGLTSKVGSEK